MIVYTIIMNINIAHVKSILITAPLYTFTARSFNRITLIIFTINLLIAQCNSLQIDILYIYSTLNRHS